VKSVLRTLQWIVEHPPCLPAVLHVNCLQIAKFSVRGWPIYSYQEHPVLDLAHFMRHASCESSGFDNSTIPYVVLRSRGKVQAESASPISRGNKKESAE